MCWLTKKLRPTLRPTAFLRCAPTASVGGPSPGNITGLNLPGGAGIRVDTAAYQGGTIPPYYDSLVAKLIAHGADRTEAIARELAAADSRVRWVPNPSGRTPDAMNAGIAAASFCTAPLGARLAHRLPGSRLKKIFALLLLAIGTKMLWGVCAG